MNHFFVLTNQPKDPEFKITKYICNFLKENGKDCSYLTLGAERMQSSCDNRNPLFIPESVECILVLGGDGTLLQAAMETLYLDIPLIGINLGTLGFLAEVDKSNLDEALMQLITDKWHQEERMMLSGTMKLLKKECKKAHALNDIVLTRSGSMRIVTYDIYVNGQFLSSYHADGVIISTPTGSTGYNMSAGGPIVEPGAKLILITPICPHTLNTRSIILSPEAEIEVRIGRGKSGKKQKAEVYFDGDSCRQLEADDGVIITKSTKVTRLIRLSSDSFLEVLHRKMSD